MYRINWVRMLIGGIVATIILFVTDGLFHEKVVTGSAQFIPLGFYSNALWIKVGAFQLVTSIVAAVAGAALYRDAVASSG